MSKTKTKKTNKVASNYPTDRQESNQSVAEKTNITMQNYIQSLRDFTQDEFSAQTKIFSELGRKLILAILATFWVICYSSSWGLDIPNKYLLVCAVSSIIYLFIDCFKYFCDSLFYHNESNLLRDQLRKGITIDPSKESDKINQRNDNFFWFFIIKALLLLFSSFTLIIGII